jgi:phage-related protein
MSDKALTWLGTSRADVRDFPEGARRAAGFELRQVQHGLSPSDWKPMPAVGAGVFEIRIHEAGEYRVLYVAKFAEAVYVLHAFEKRTRQTPGVAIDLARRRYKQLQRARRRREE